MPPVSGPALTINARGTGRPVVLLHGFPMDHSIWDRQVEALASRYRMITPDMRAVRDSVANPGTITIEHWADALAAMLETMKITEPIVLGGLSMGGYIAFQFFQAH